MQIPNRSKRRNAVLMLVLGLLTAAQTAGQDSPGASKDSDRPRFKEPAADTAAAATWDRKLPIFGAEAVKRGYEIPLPFGISANLIYLKRDIQVKNIRAAFVGNPLQDVDDFFSIDIGVEVVNYAARFDVWIFPFLNVYGLAGHTTSKNAVDVAFTLPGPLPVEAMVMEKVDTSGPTYGGGLTIAWGHKQMFVVADANRTFTDLGNLGGKIDAFIASFRGGWNGKIGRRNTRIWAGAMYWDTEREISGQGTTPMGRDVAFSVVQGPVNDWNATVGANIEFSKHWNLLLEYGFYKDLDMLISGINFRF